MKKLLTLFLALITVLSVTLVACNDSTPPSTSDDDGGNEFVSRNPTTSDTSDTDKDDKNNTGAWTEVNYAIYAMADNLNIRAEASGSSTSLGKVNIGTSLTAVAKSDDWYKISYTDGTDGVAYVSADFVTTVENESKFTDYATDSEDRKALVIKEEGTNENPYTVYLRKNPSLDEEDSVSINREKTSGDKLMKVGVNASGNIWKVTYNGGTYYIGAGAFKYFEGYTGGGSTSDRG